MRSIPVIYINTALLATGDIKVIYPNSQIETRMLHKLLIPQQNKK